MTMTTTMQMTRTDNGGRRRSSDPISHQVVLPLNGWQVRSLLELRLGLTLMNLDRRQCQCSCVANWPTDAPLVMDVMANGGQG